MLLTGFLILSVLAILFLLILLRVITLRTYEFHKIIEKQDKTIKQMNEAYLNIFDNLQNFSGHLHAAAAPLSMYYGDTNIKDLVTHTQYIIKYVKEAVAPFSKDLMELEDDEEYEKGAAQANRGITQSRLSGNTRTIRQRKEKGNFTQS